MPRVHTPSRPPLPTPTLQTRRYLIVAERGPRVRIGLRDLGPNDVQPLTPTDPSFEADMAEARRIMKKRRAVLRELAK